MNKKANSKQSSKAAVMLREELTGYEKSGTRLYLEGRRCNPDEIVKACLVADGCSYMRDFISNEKDTITDINFVKICSDKTGKTDRK